MSNHGRKIYCSIRCSTQANIHKACERNKREDVKIRNIRCCVGMRIYRGTLKRLNCCANCGKKCRPDVHHPDYNKPFLIQWLCRSCHKFLHLKDNENEIRTI